MAHSSRIPPAAKLLGWPRHKSGLDSLVARQGRGSLRLTLAEEDERVYTAAWPLDSVRGQLATVSGWVRTRGSRGRAGLYAFAHATTAGPGPDRAAVLDSLPAAMDWRRLEVRLPVKAMAACGLMRCGCGWGGRRVGTAPQPGTEALLPTAAEALAPNCAGFDTG